MKTKAEMIEAIDSVGLAEFHVRAIHDTCEALGERNGDENEHIWCMLKTEAALAAEELDRAKARLNDKLRAMQAPS